MRHQQKNEISYEKKPKNEGNDGGGGKKNNNKEDGIVRDKNGKISCCVPFLNCTRSGHPLPETLADGIKFSCTNPACLFTKHLVHPECFDSLETSLMKLLTSQGYKYCKNKGVLLTKERLWEQKGLALIQKNLKCECGKGIMKRDDEAWAEREEMLASPAALEENEKKKHKPAKELPTLQLTVKKGAPPPPPNFHRLNTHYASSHSPTRYETFIEDKYAPAPPPAPTKTTTPTAAATTNMFGNYVPSNHATLSKSSIIDQSAVKKPVRNVPIGIDSFENLFSRSNEAVKESIEEWPSLIQQPKISQAPSRTVTSKPMERTVKSADVDKKKVEERWTSLNLQPKDSTPSVKPKPTKAPAPTITLKPREKTVKSSAANKKQVEEEWPSLSRQPMDTKASNPFENVKPIKNFVVAAKAVKNTVESKTREVLKNEFTVERSPSDLEWEQWDSEVKELVVERSRSPSLEMDNWNSEMSEPVPTLNFKTFKSVEIQTDETSFPQTFEQRQNFVSTIDYHSGRYSISPKLSRPSNELRRNTEITTSSGFGSGGASPLQTIVLSKFPAIVTFLFKNDNTFAIEIDQNGKIEKLNNNFDNEWTPLYLSMAERSLEIGEMAQIHYLDFPKYVVYDVLNIIGKPLNQIEINPYWQFKVIENNGIKCFEVETSNGRRLIPEDTVLAAFLKKMKEKAENNLNTEIREIFISSNFGFTESQKNVFKNAALKIGLNVLEFFVNNI